MGRKKYNEKDFIKWGKRAGVKPKVKDWAKVTTETSIAWLCLIDKNHMVKNLSRTNMITNLRKNPNYTPCLDCKKQARFDYIDGLARINGLALVRVIKVENIVVRCLTDPTHGEWTTTVSRLKKGSSCSKCYYDSKRIPIEDYKKAPGDRPFSFIIDSYTGNTSDPVWWRCEAGLGHDDWQSTYSNIFYMTKGCPECSYLITADKTRIPIEDYKKAPGDRPFSFIIDSYTGNTSDPVWWRCEAGLGHDDWLRSYNKIVYADGLCPECNGTKSKGETKLNQLLARAAQRGSHIRVDTQVRFDGLTGVNGGQLSFDGLLAGKKKKILIEINGKQHYEYDPYFHKAGKIDFYKQLIHDYRKMLYAYDNGYIYVAIRTKDINNMAAIVNHYIAKGKPTKPTKPNIPILVQMKLKVKL